MYERKTSEQLHELANDIEKVLDDHPYPMPNATAMSQLEQLARRFNGLDTYAAEKAGVLAGLSQRFYSARKHHRHPGGADHLYHQMRYDLLHRIRSWADVCAQEGN